jgi:hypothetical protein
MILKKAECTSYGKSIIKFDYHNLNLMKGDAHEIHRIRFTQKKYFCNSFGR